MNPEVFKITVEFDSFANSPCEEDGWKVYSFNNRHINYRNPFEILCRRSGETKAINIGLQRKLDVGTAFLISCYDHSSVQWGLQGEVFQCQWDTTQCAGIMIWEGKLKDLGPKTYKDRQEDARKFLNVYTDWANGNVFCYRVEYVGGKRDSFGGFYGTDELISSLKEEYPEIFDKNGKIKESILIEGEAREALSCV